MSAKILIISIVTVFCVTNAIGFSQLEKLLGGGLGKFENYNPSHDLRMGECNPDCSTDKACAEFCPGYAFGFSEILFHVNDEFKTLVNVSSSCTSNNETCSTVVVTGEATDGTNCNPGGIKFCPMLPFTLSTLDFTECKQNVAYNVTLTDSCNSMTFPSFKAKIIKNAAAPCNNFCF